MMTTASDDEQVSARSRSRARPHDTGDANTPAAVWVDVAELRPWKKNPRRNDGEPVRRVADSIKRFGFGAPILARQATGEIIAGHTRWKAARMLELERVPVRYIDVNEHDAHLLALADNRLGELAEWDASLEQLVAGMDPGDVLAAGWKQAELDTLLSQLAIDASPAADDPERLDRVDGTICPNCGHQLK